VVRLAKSASRTADQTIVTTRALLERAAAELGVAADRTKVFEHLGYFAILAPVRLLRHLARQPEVETLRVNRPRPA